MTSELQNYHLHDPYCIFSSGFFNSKNRNKEKHLYGQIELSSKMTIKVGLYDKTIDSTSKQLKWSDLAQPGKKP